MIESLEDNALSELLSSFSCAKDSDIESFLHNKAIEFENLSPAYMDYKNTPYYINEFRNLVMDDISKEIGNNINIFWRKK